MSICKACADAADGKTRGGLTCSWCGRPGVSVYRTDIPIEDQRVMFHKDRTQPSSLSLRRTGDPVWVHPKCPGSGSPPEVVNGHDDCDGCPCQHRPSGSWKGNRS